MPPITRGGAHAQAAFDDDLSVPFANAINYIDRANLAVAAPAVEADLGIDAATMGLLRSGFFWTRLCENGASL
jgi:hypothetical protein